MHQKGEAQKGQGPMKDQLPTAGHYYKAQGM